jgi:hypothetical protein
VNANNANVQVNNHNKNDPTGPEVRMDAVSYDRVESIWKQMRTIVSNLSLVLMTLALCSLYYVVTGMQV